MLEFVVVWFFIFCVVVGVWGVVFGVLVFEGKGVVEGLVLGVEVLELFILIIVLLGLILLVIFFC